MTFEEASNVIKTWILPMRKTLKSDMADEFFDSVETLIKKEIKYEWHNLLKNPDDLPNDNDFKKDYVIIFDNNNKCVSRFYGRGESCQGYYEYPKGVWEAHQYYDGDVIAWKEIEEFDEVTE